MTKTIILTKEDRKFIKEYICYTILILGGIMYLVWILIKLKQYWNII